MGNTKSASTAIILTGEKEKALVKALNDEIAERILNQVIIYFPIDLQSSNFHPLYGECIEKQFLPPIKINCLVEWNGIETDNEKFSDKQIKINVKFQKKRINEDIGLDVREGDYILYNSIFFEIVSLKDDRLLFGQADSNFQVLAECIRARNDQFLKQKLNV